MKKKNTDQRNLAETILASTIYDSEFNPLKLTSELEEIIEEAISYVAEKEEAYATLAAIKKGRSELIAKKIAHFMKVLERLKTKMEQGGGSTLPRTMKAIQRQLQKLVSLE